MIVSIRRHDIAHNLARHPVHLGPGASAVIQPEFTGGMDWYQGYGERHGGDGAEGRLVSLHSFSESWTSWEMHPAGTEMVLCTAGTITLIQEMPGRTERGVTLNRIMLNPGDYAINEPGIWHTADVAGQATAVFITTGEGTMHRERS